MTSVKPAPTRAAQAFGMDLALGVDAPGLTAGRGSTQGRMLTIEAVSAGGLSALWGGSDAVRMHERRWEDGSLAWTIDFEPSRGYLVWADGYGRFLLSRDGSRLLCCPEEAEAWRWQLLLVGQLAPFAAVLQGLEVFHASVVAIGDEAVAFTGPSRAGKSSVAASLVLKGARFLADDVLVLEAVGEELLAHSGPGLASVRHEFLRDLTQAERRRLGRVLGYDAEGARVALPREDRSLPLRALYVLDRAGGTEPQVEPLDPPDPRILLGATFNLFLQTPARLLNQLELCRLVAERVTVARLRVPEAIDARALAETVLALHSARA